MNKPLGYIEVLRSGIGCSIQDQGRFGYLSEGIPISGVMDQNLAGLANLLVGNVNNEAVIEWKLIPPKIVFSVDSIVAITGANIQVFVNSTLIESFKPIFVKKGDILNLKLNKVQGYGYVAIMGGIQTKEVLGSRSFYSNITQYRFLEKKMKLPILKLNKEKLEVTLSHIKPPEFDKDIIELLVIKGPEFDLLSKKEQKQLPKKLFSLNHQSNRMGFLLNEPIKKHQESMLSSPVLPGTVQWTPSGKLIILMRDAQTVGGYPRVLQLKEDSISKLARVAPNGFVKFNY